MPAGPAVPPFVEIAGAEDVARALDLLGVRPGRPVLVVVGGAGGMSEADRSLVDGLLRGRLLPALVELEAAVVDGGTDAGVMRLLGAAREAAGNAVPLVGVAAAGTVRLPGRATPADDAADLEPRHTGVVVVPGTAWGDESGWLADVAGLLAGAAGSVTLVVNGGEITYHDVEASLAAKRPVVVLAGSGRTADAIAGALAGARAGTPPPSDRMLRIVDSSLVTAVPLSDPGGVVAAVVRALGGAP